MGHWKMTVLQMKKTIYFTYVLLTGAKYQVIPATTPPVNHPIVVYVSEVASATIRGLYLFMCTSVGGALLLTRVDWLSYTPRIICL